MSEEIGDAYVRIHSDDTGFEAEVIAQVEKAIAAADKIAKVNLKVNQRVANSAQTAVASQVRAANDVADAQISASRRAEAELERASAAFAAAKKAELEASRNYTDAVFTSDRQLHAELDGTRERFTAAQIADLQRVKDEARKAVLETNEAYVNAYNANTAAAKESSVAQAKAADDAADAVKRSIKDVDDEAELSANKRIQLEDKVRVAEQATQERARVALARFAAQQESIRDGVARRAQQAADASVKAQEDANREALRDYIASENEKTAAHEAALKQQKAMDDAKRAAGHAANDQAIRDYRQRETEITAAHAAALRAQHELDQAANSRRAAEQRANLVPGDQSLRSLPASSRSTFQSTGEDLSALARANRVAADDIDRSATRVAQSIRTKLTGAVQLTEGEFEHLRQTVGAAMAEAAESVDKSARNIAGSGARAAEDFFKNFKGHTGDFGDLFNDLKKVEGAADDAGGAFSRFSAKSKELAFNMHDLRTPLLAAGIGFGVLAAAAGVAAVAVAGLSVFAGEQLRTLTLQLESTGASAEDVAANIKDLQELANKGLNFAALGKDDKTLIDLGLKAKDATNLLGGLANVFAGQGQIGTTLQASVDAASEAIAKLVQGTNVTSKNIGTAIAGLGLGVAPKAVFKELQTELGVTQKQLDKLIATGKVTGGQVARAAVTAAQAQPNAANGLNNAVNQSPTQAIFAVKSQVLQALTGVIDNPEIAQAINRIGGDLTKAIGNAFGGAGGDKLTKGLVHAIDAIGSAIVPVSKFLVQFAGSLGAFFNEATTEGTKANTFFVDFGKTVAIIAHVIEDLLPLFEGVAGGIDIFFKAVQGLAVAVNDVLTPFKALNDIIEKFTGFDIGSKILLTVGAFAGFALAANGARVVLLKLVATFVQALGPIGAFIAETFATVGALIAEEGIIGGLIASLEGLAVATAAALGPIGLTIAAIALLTVGFIEAWKHSETFRDVVVKVFQVVLHAVVAPIQIIIGEIQLFIKALALMASAASHIPIIGGKFKGVADSLNGAADAVGGLNGKINDAIGDLDSLANVGVNAGNKTGDSFNSAASSVAIFNNYLGLSGDKALSASADMVELNSAIAALPTEKQIDINVLITTQIGKENTDFLNKNGVPLTGLEDATGFSTAGIQKAAAEQAARDAADKAAAAIPSFNNPSGSGGAASKAKTAADNLKNALHNILLGLDSDFKHGLIAGDAKNAEKTLNTLAENIIKAFRAAKKPPPSNLIDFLDKENKKLQSLIKQRDAITARLDAAKTASDSAISGAQGFGDITAAAQSLDSLSSAADGANKSLSDLSHLRIVKPGQGLAALNDTALNGKAALSAAQSDTNNIQAALDKRLLALQQFNANIKKLVKEGLNKDSLSQIINAGVEGGGATAAALAGASASSIAAINKTQAAITAQAKALGSVAGDVAATTGEQVVLGLVKGLKSQKSDLVKAITDLVDTIIKRVKKGLDIKSPSRVLHKLGAFAGAGLVGGLEAHVPHVENVAAKLAKAAMPNLQPISALELSGRANAEAMAGIREGRAVANNGGGTVDNSRTVNNNYATHIPSMTAVFQQQPGESHAHAMARFERAVANGVRR